MTLQSLDKYGTSFQIKVISSLLTHPKFLLNIHDVLSEEFFNNSAHKWIIQQILKYYDKYHTSLSMEVLKVELQKVKNEVLVISIKEQLQKAYKASEDDLNYVQEEFSDFCKNQQLTKALMNSVDLIQGGDYDSIRILINNALKAGQDKNLGHEYNKDIEARYRKDSRITVPTPWPDVNRLLQGGLGNGDFGVIFGSPGGGKSWMLIALGAIAIKLGYNVLHYTLELGEMYVGKRYDAVLSKIPVDQLDGHQKEIQSMVDKVEGKLIIREYPAKKASLSTIEAHIEKTKELGVKPDLILIDYLDLLSSTRKFNDTKAEIDYIYTSTRGLARELQLPIWSVSQVNRAGAQDRVVQGDKAAGSYDKLMTTDFCMSLARGPKDKVEGTGRAHIIKNRYGPDGLTYNVAVDTAIGDFQLSEYTGDDDDEENNQQGQQGYQKQNSYGNTFSGDEKNSLQEKFFNLKQ